MSKAFTRESDDAPPAENFTSRVQAASGRKSFITKAGAERLKTELAALLQSKRSADAQTAGAGEAKIRYMQRVLAAAVVVEPPVDRGRIAFGACTRVRHCDGEEASYQIVGPDEIDLEQGRISWLSPLAKALISHTAGEKVTFRTPAGDDTLEILSVEYPDL